MFAYFARRSQGLVQTALRLPDQVGDRSLKMLMALTAVSLVGFGVYYYVDRYAVSVPPISQQFLRDLEARVVQDPQNPEARVQVAWAYLDQDRYGQAVAQFDEALKLRENYQAALIGKGTAYVRKGDLKAALGPFEQVAELNKDNPFKRTLRELQAVYYHLGTIYADQKKDDQAVAAFREALDIDRADADSLYGLGMVYLRQGDAAQARPLLEQAVRLDPVFADAYHALKTVYEQQGMAGHALVARAMLSYIQGDYDRAAGLLGQAVRVLPDLPEAYQALGLVYDKQGQRDEALVAYRTALEKNPDLPLAQGGVARLSR